MALVTSLYFGSTNELSSSVLVSSNPVFCVLQVRDLSVRQRQVCCLIPSEAFNYSTVLNDKVSSGLLTRTIVIMNEIISAVDG